MTFWTIISLISLAGLIWNGHSLIVKYISFGVSTSVSMHYFHVVNKFRNFCSVDFDGLNDKHSKACYSDVRLVNFFLAISTEPQMCRSIHTFTYIDYCISLRIRDTSKFATACPCIRKYEKTIIYELKTSTK